MLFTAQYRAVRGPQVGGCQWVGNRCRTNYKVQWLMNINIASEMDSCNQLHVHSYAYLGQMCVTYCYD